MYAEQPIATDSRIKTFVYNESEIYRLLINYGFQTSIEFSKDETIDTISLGNTYAWQLTPVSNRIFIKPLESNIHTNLSIITNKRVYYFEILSTEPSKQPNEMLAYVVKFYYPQKEEKTTVDPSLQKWIQEQEDKVYLQSVDSIDQEKQNAIAD